MLGRFGHRLSPVSPVLAVVTGVVTGVVSGVVTSISENYGWLSDFC